MAGAVRRASEDQERPEPIGPWGALLAPARLAHEPSSHSSHGQAYAAVLGQFFTHAPLVPHTTQDLVPADTGSGKTQVTVPGPPATVTSGRYPGSVVSRGEGDCAAWACTASVVKYVPSDKHKHPWQRGRKGSLCPRDLEVDPQVLLDGSAWSPREPNKRWATDGTRAFCAMRTSDDEWHGFPVRFFEVPADICRRWEAEGLASRHAQRADLRAEKRQARRRR